MKEDEECFKNITECLAEYKVYPFDPDLPTLRTMQSGVPAPQKLVNDVRSAGQMVKRLLKQIYRREFIHVARPNPSMLE